MSYRRRVMRGGQTDYEYRILTGAKAGQIVDHIDHDMTNNAPENLRLTDKQGNGANRAGAQRNNRSGHLGVSRRSNGTWIGYVHYRGKQYARSFPTMQEAIDFREWLADEFFGAYKP